MSASASPQDVEAALRSFAKDLTAIFRSSAPAQPEDQLKAPVMKLLKEAGTALSLTVTSKTEVQVEGLGGRPDIGVEVSGLRAGFVELKAPGKGARPERLTGADKLQWEKFKALPNLVYTDGSEWTFYRSGERQGQILRFAGDATTDGATAVNTDDAARFLVILRDFLLWKPITPTSAKALAQMLAPLCRLVRDDVSSALERENANLLALRDEWKKRLFPDADDAQFADAYAQTLTYALLLARFEGEKDLDRDSASAALGRGHSLLAQALKLLEDDQVRPEIALGIDLLERVIEAVDPVALTKKGADPWLYFYEDFLAAYDAKLRNQRGVFYTPVEVVRAQVTLVSWLLEDKFGKASAFADADVRVLDPAVGTGTYLLAVLEGSLARVAGSLGEGAVASYASQMARNLFGFELLVGPYSVAHLRLTQAILEHGGSLPEHGAHVFLTNTLESPHAVPQGQQVIPFGSMYKELAEEHDRAMQVKATTPILVCIGNPPYNRQQIDAADSDTETRKGDWVRFGDSDADRPILADFIDPAKDAGAGVHLKNLYNDYVYFWRWALWKVFESTKPKGPGIVSFITASSYLRGPGFVGMREVMRKTLDELWIIDLEGGSGARKTENVFAVQTPVAIGIGVRYGKPNAAKPAKILYTKIVGTQAEKLALLGEISAFSSLDWRKCMDGWQDAFLPAGQGDFFAWPQLSDLFPWQHSGVELKRTWCKRRSKTDPPLG